MQVFFTEKFKSGVSALRKEDVKLPYKVWELLFDVLKSPFDGLGKPEPLKNQKGAWSRRIDQKHRLVYKIEANVVYLISCYGHYED